LLASGEIKHIIFVSVTAFSFIIITLARGGEQKGVGLQILISRAIGMPAGCWLELISSTPFFRSPLASIKIIIFAPLPLLVLYLFLFVLSYPTRQRRAIKRCGLEILTNRVTGMPAGKGIFLVGH